MIVVDSSVLIAWLRDEQTLKTELFARAAAEEQVLLGDLVMMEVLQGARSEANAGRLRRALREFELEEMVSEQSAEQAAFYFRRLRALGFTIRKQTDLLIGTFCIMHGHELLHADRDFEPMERHLGLRTVASADRIH